MELLSFLRTQVHANRLANHRLHTAMRALSRGDFDAPRTSFFPSLAKTLEHILAVDLYYLAALHGERGAERIWREAPAGVPFEAIAAAQAASDQRFIDHVETLGAPLLDESSRWSAARAASSASGAATSSPTCSTTRCTTAARCTRCWPAPRPARRSSTSS